MTKPKHPPHRLGFRDGRDDPSRRPYVRTAEDVREFGRWVWLRTVAEEIPDVLRTLAAVPQATDDPMRPDAPALEAWSARWNLRADWCLAYARGTWGEWQRFPAMQRTYWCDRDDVIGELVDDAYERQPSSPRRLKDPDHMRWLARCVCLVEPWSEISDGRSIKTVTDACKDLAELLDIPLPVRRRGRPRRDEDSD